MSKTLIETRPRPTTVPPLRDGDRLTRDEFERRWDATPDVVRAELIEGVVRMPPPVSHHDHGVPQTRLAYALLRYEELTPGTVASDNSSLRLDPPNMPQPDLYLMIRPECGGQAGYSGRYVVGGPELVAEVSASSADADRTAKREVYRRNGVREYVVWRTYDFQFDFLLLVGGDYERQSADADDVYRSRVFPGLWLDVPQLLAGNLGGIRRTLDRGIATPEHATFAAGLAKAAGQP